MNIALIGDKDSIAMFKLAGVRNCYDLDSSFDEIANNENVAILLVTDEYAEKMKDEIIHHRLTKKFPIIIEISGKKKIEREDTIKRLIIRAVGIEVK